MHKVYFVGILIWAGLISCVFSQGCEKLNATFTSNPPICTPTYNIPTQYNNNTGGDYLFSLFSSLSPLPSRACATSYAEYYCSEYYPSCDASNNTQVLCADTCYNLLTDCDDDKDLFINASLPYPEVAECNSLSHDATCAATSDVDLSSLYIDCQVPNKTNFDVSVETNIICSVNHTVIIMDNSYTLGDNVWKSLGTFAQNFNSLNDTLEPCMQSFANFYCSLAFPSCPAGEDIRNKQQVCRSACQAVMNDCAEWADDFVYPTNLGGYIVPNVSWCNTFPTTNCYLPDSNDTDLFFFFSGSGEPTIAPSSSFEEESDSHVPPGGWGKGAGLGTGVLIALLVVIGVLMLIMKKQDSR